MKVLEHVFYPDVDSSLIKLLRKLQLHFQSLKMKCFDRPVETTLMSVGVHFKRLL